MTLVMAPVDTWTPSSVAADSLAVEIVTEEKVFFDLEPVWNDLVERAGIDHPFLTYEWMRAWWESFGAGRTLHILVVTADGQPIAIAPLMLTRESLCGIPVRRLGFMANVHTPRADFIIADRLPEVCRAIWQSLAGRANEWDVLELCQLADMRAGEELSRLARADGFGTGVWHSAASPYIRLQGTWDEYFGTLDRKFRSNLRNRLKRVNALGTVKLEMVEGGSQLVSALEEGLKIEAAAWKGSAGTAIGCNPELRRFYTTLAHRTAERGWLRLQFLTVNGQRIAFGYSLCREGKLYLLKPGYDPQYAPYSPCNLMCYLVLQDGFQHGLTEYDLLGVSDGWKLEWTQTARPHDWLYVFSKSWRMNLIRFIKFRMIPKLKRLPVYMALRDMVLKAQE